MKLAYKNSDHFTQSLEKAAQVIKPRELHVEKKCGKSAIRKTYLVDYLAELITSILCFSIEHNNPNN